MRAAETYRGARRNGSGAKTTHSPVDKRMIKVRPVPARPLLPKATRQALLDAKRQTKAAQKALVGVIAPFAAARPARKRNEPLKGKINLGADHSLRKRMRSANRKGDAFAPTREAMMRHKRYRDAAMVAE